jgi:ADP-ribose pyrophosphatase YjhB (NUDIX family)
MECHAHRLVADVAPLSGRRVLLVRYRDVSRYDGQRGWFLPDDLLNHGEHPDDAARRILAEQVGIDSAVRLAHIESFGNGRWHLVFHYVADVASGVRVMPGKNVADADWFELERLPDAAEIAHDGWARDVLEKIVTERATA